MKLKTALSELKFWRNRLVFFLQERVQCTEKEAIVLITLFTLIILGNVLQMARASEPLFDDDYYAETDSLFRALSRRADSLDAIDTVRVGFPRDYTQLQSMGKETEMWVIVDTLEKPKASFPININSANAKTLQALPRIGPRMAERIIAFRLLNGPFTDVSELTQVKGIGSKTLEKLLPLVTLQEVSSQAESSLEESSQEAPSQETSPDSLREESTAVPDTLAVSS